MTTQSTSFTRTNPPAPDMGEVRDLHLNLVRRLVALRHSASLDMIEKHLASNPNHATRLNQALESYEAKAAARAWVDEHYGPAAAAVPERKRDPRDSLHIYGRMAAASLELGSREDVPVIVVDAALAMTGVQRRYNWQDKVSLTLSFSESCEMLLVMLGERSKAEVRYHGSARDKSIDLTLQPPNVAMRVVAAGVGPRMVPITPRNRLAAADLLLRYLHRLSPERSQTEWLALLTRCLGGLSGEPSEETKGA